MESKKKKQKSTKAPQYEDAVMKTMAQFFADELLPYFGIEGKVAGIAPTELVQVEVRKKYQDMNLVMEDGSWKHFEFQSCNGGIKDLKRFRSYEADTSYQYNVSVTTYVLYSGDIHKPMTEFSEGVNTYRVVPITLADMDGDALLNKLKVKNNTGAVLEGSDLISLALCPLMGGKMKTSEKIKSAYEILYQASMLNAEEKDKIEAVLYAMAEKFLESVDMEEIKEMVRMTRLGQMLLEEGMEEGMKQEKIQNAKNLLDILPEEVIAERLGLSLETVQKLKEEAKK